MTRDEEELAFHYELGRAMAAWGDLENHLGSIAQIRVTGQGSGMMLQGFYAIEQFRSKLRFVDAVMRHKEPTVSDELLEVWGSIFDALQSFSEARNQLAHRHAIGFNYEPRIPGRHIALIQYSKLMKAPATANGGPPSDSFCLRDLAKIRLDFESLHPTMFDFIQALLGYEKPPPKYEQPDARPPDIPTLRNRMRAALGLPPAPSRVSRRSPGDAAAELSRQHPQSHQ